MKNKSLEIRILNLEQLKTVYKTYMIKDFPKSELKPWTSLERMYREGCYQCLGLYEEDVLNAYACLAAGTGESKQVLLDYFAVSPARRGGGYGSRFLSLLKEKLSDKDGIILEIERIASAVNQDEALIRTRRMDFYEKNGAYGTGLELKVYGVDYSILYIPVQRKADVNMVREELMGIYRNIVPDKKIEDKVEFL